MQPFLVLIICVLGVTVHFTTINAFALFFFFLILFYNYYDLISFLLLFLSKPKTDLNRVKTHLPTLTFSQGDTHKT